ncbi:MAG: hypothetical protein FJ164_01670 [Gammaproteobacteria bacterium]|nr:hypothetical protein [Gammaproteobacteria bacterium]
MLRARLPFVALMVVLLGSAHAARADAALDAELDAAWGDGGSATQTMETPQSQFEAKLKLLEAQRDAGMNRCRSKSGGQRYCTKYAEELYRKARRQLEQEFEGQLEDAEVSRNESKGFGRR